MGYAKTERGQEVVKTRSVALAPRLRTLLLLCDGRRTGPELLASVAGTAQADLDDLLAQGLIEPTAAVPVGASRPAAATQAAAGNTAAAQAEVPADAAAPAVADEATRYREAYAVATQLVADLGLRGFRLQLAVEAAMTLKDLADLAPRLREALEKAHTPGTRAKLATFDRALKGG